MEHWTESPVEENYLKFPNHFFSMFLSFNSIMHCWMSQSVDGAIFFSFCFTPSHQNGFQINEKKIFHFTQTCCFNLNIIETSEAKSEKRKKGKHPHQIIIYILSWNLVTCVLVCCSCSWWPGKMKMKSAYIGVLKVKHQ